VELRVDHGIVGDAHAGNWHRQVSLLGQESVDKLQGKLDFQLKPGDFAENILTEGICVYKIPVGSKVKLGTALCEVTQIGKTCHNDCAIRQKAGDCVMPREGIFVKVLEPGVVKAGDEVSVVEE
jgi:MOSC domain-containing protein YiiM